MSKKNLIGKKFGRLLVISESGNRSGRTAWLCKCDCGNYKTIVSKSLLNGSTKSCGCLSREKTIIQNTKHGKRHTRIYRIWLMMKNRCTNPKDLNWKYYGGKGIIVCDEWKNDFIAFYNWSVANGYSDNLSIDRINSDGNYEPNNCRWATNIEQQNNKTSNHYITFQNKTQSMKMWAEELGINYSTLRARINTYGWSVEKAFQTRIGERNEKGK